MDAFLSPPREEALQLAPRCRPAGTRPGLPVMLMQLLFSSCCSGRAVAQPHVLQCSAAGDAGLCSPDLGPAASALAFSLLSHRFGTTQGVAAALPVCARVLLLGPGGCCPPVPLSPSSCSSVTHRHSSGCWGGQGRASVVPSPALCTSHRAPLGLEGWRHRRAAFPAHGGGPCPRALSPNSRCLSVSRAA